MTGKSYRRTLLNRIFTVLVFISFLIIASGCGNGGTDAQENNSEKFSHPEWSYNQTIYEVNVRQYTPQGTFNAFAEHLPRLKETGAGIIWLMPIHPIGEKNRKGSLGSYYSVKDFKGINPEFGTEEDFRALVDAIHAQGMYVIIDWVANHTSWDNVWVEEHSDFYTKDSAGNFVPPVADWSDVIDLNYNNPELRDSMRSALEYWVREFDIDGYRCDVAAMVPFDFWSGVRAELDKIKPVFMLAEASEPELHENGFDMTYNWQLKNVMNDIAAGKADAEKLREHFAEEDAQYPDDAFRMTFTTNHDENTWHGTVFERLGDGAATFAVLTATTEGMPLLYSGQEAGLDKRLEFFEKDPIEWNEHPFEELYTKLFNLNKTNKALFNGRAGGEAVLLTVKEEPGKIFAFTREKEGDKVLTVLNLSGEEVSSEVSGKTLQGNYTGLFSGQAAEYDTAATFAMQPWEYKVYVKSAE